MDIDTDVYEYSTLHENQIRLLHLYPGLYDDELLSSLEDTTLEQRPRYEALSYTWGTSIKNCHISCRTDTGLKRITITSNLQVALLRMRSTERTRIFWIDQVCINQDDGRERSSQVSRMGAIYSSAFQVSIWIGEEDEDAQLAFRFLPIMLSYMPSSTSITKVEQEYVWPSDALLVVRSEGWEALARIFDRPWFRRVWVIQETAMAAQAQVCCGSFIVPWDDLARACRIQMRQQSLRQGHNALESIDKTRRKRIEGGNDLYDTLFMSYRFQCTDPRDKIYAVVGLANLPQEERLTFDYDSGIEEIYLRSAVNLMLSDGSLDLLHCVVHRTMASRLPSWVPDWRSEPLICCMLKEQSVNLDQPHSNASLQFIFSEDHSALTVTGRHIGSISTLGMTMSNDDREEVISQWHGIAESISKSGSDTYPSNYFQTLTATTKVDAGIESLYAAWTNVKRRVSHSVDYQVPVSLAAENQKALEFDGLMLEACTGRRLIVLDGCVVGLGPSESHEGDLVCCFEDTRNPLIPFVIRCRGDSYQLIGQSFVPALSSQGSWFRSKFPGQAKQHFLLR